LPTILAAWSTALVNWCKSTSETTSNDGIVIDPEVADPGVT
jgi:hypothetical protein